MIELSEKQITEVCEKLNKTYIDLIDKAYKKAISKYSLLKTKSAFYDYNYVEFKLSGDRFEAKVASFRNYPYELKQSSDKAELKKLAVQFKKDLLAFEKDFKASLPKDKKYMLIYLDMKNIIL